MIEEIIVLYLEWHTKQHKLVRCALKAFGFILAISTVPIWVPALLILYCVLNLIIAVVEFFESA